MAGKKKPAPKDEGKSKAKDTAALRKMEGMAKRINAELDRAATADKRADDLRVTAAKELAAAKEFAEEKKIPFKAWCEENINYSYDEARKLAKIGAADDPALALADMRAGSKKRAAKTRAKQAAAKAEPKQVEGPKKTPLQVADAALDSMGEKGALEHIRSYAKGLGFAVVSENEAKKAKEAVKKSVEVAAGALDALKIDFKALTGKDKTAFVKWAAEEMGFALSNPFEGEDPLDIPPALKRTAGKKGKKAA